MKASTRERSILGFLLCLFLLLSQLPFSQLEIPFGVAAYGVWTIDLYSQKEPYSGKGPNQPGDAFAPLELVFLSALVLYSDAPVPGILVGFEVFGPTNPVQNISFFRTVETGSNGIANISFRIPSAYVYADQVLFGSWTAVAAFDIAEVKVKDTLWFRVGWIVQPVKVDILDAQNTSRTRFFLGDLMRFKITVENIAMTAKAATLIVAVFDNASAPIGQVILRDQAVPPDTSNYYTGALAISDGTAVGLGTVFVNAYTLPPDLGGWPWSPEIRATFEIVSTILRDVAVVLVEFSPSKAYRGGIVSVSVTVENKGEMVESFNVTVFFDARSVEPLVHVGNLAVGEKRTLALNWNTSSVVPGQYNISARASPVPGETNLVDNTYIGGIVDVLPVPTQSDGLPPPDQTCPSSILPYLLLFLLLLAVALLGLLLGFVLGRRRKKDASPSETTGDDALQNLGNVFRCPLLFHHAFATV